MVRNGLAAFGLYLLAALPVSASDWHSRVTLYGWLPGLSGTIGTPVGDIDLGGGETDLSALDSFFMGALELRNGRVGLIVDYVGAGFSETFSNSAGGYLSVATTTDVSQTTGYLFYRFSETDAVSADLLIGARGFRIKIGAAYSDGSNPDVTFGATLKQTVAVFGGRVRYRINENWFITGLFDLGSNGSDLSSYQILGLAGYQFNDLWSVIGGYRYLNLSDAGGGITADINLGGPFIGVMLDF